MAEEDLGITLGVGTIDELVAFIIEAGLANVDPEQTVIEIQTRFRISPDDAELAMDRTYGGIFRAGTTSPNNRPHSRLDPIAYASYKRARRDPAIIQRLGPSFTA